MIIDFIKNFVYTEKTVRLIEEKNQYTFDVDVKLTKTEIKKFFQTFFNVTLKSVNVHRLPSSSPKQLKRTIITLKNF